LENECTYYTLCVHVVWSFLDPVLLFTARNTIYSDYKIGFRSPFLRHTQDEKWKLRFTIVQYICNLFNNIYVGSRCDILFHVMFRGAAAEYDKVKTYTRTHFINIDIQIPTLQLDNYNYIGIAVHMFSCS